ncbi:MAG: hypothetical protein CL792_05340 [Chloroflexi bacterium]|nr:hypothetical protein [Chloroflexota bacterium]|tara:strand:- start:254 stop:535 length:282 start_codon:yes stop_codon:yes gene_type:complete
MNKIQILNPTKNGPVQTESNSEILELRESRAGILANQKQHASLVMEAIIDQLSHDYGVIKTVVASKITNGPTPKELESELVENCDWVILGSAD